MDGEGGRTVESRHRDSGFDLPAILARLDDDDPESRRRAVETVREAAADRPEAVIPTVPKLRTLLARSEAAVREEIAYCLAELADAYPEDVAPSVDDLASFAANHGSDPATEDVLRCLSNVAEARPDAVVDHVERIVAALESRPASEWGVAVVAAVSREYPAAIEEHCPTIVDALDSDDPSTRANAAVTLARVAAGTPGVIRSGRERLLELLEDDHAGVRANACIALGEGRVERAREPLEELATGDPEPEVRERASRALSKLP